jgi:hypothetical protein
VTKERRLRAAVAFLVVLAGCHSGAASSADKAPGGQAARTQTVSGAPEQDGATPSSTTPRAKSSHVAPQSGSPSSTTRPANATSSSAQRFQYLVRGTQSGISYGMDYDLDATIVDKPDGGFTATWTDSHNTGEGGGRPPETETVRKLADGWGGSFFLGDAAHWGGWSYQPPPLLAPAHYEQGRSWPIDSVYQGDNGAGTVVNYHLTGSVQLTGQENVTVAGRHCLTWLLHDTWRVVDENNARAGDSSGSGDFWWCPDMRLFVKAATDTQSPNYLPSSSPIQDHTVTTIVGLVEQ